MGATITLSNKKLVSIIVATWILSLVSTVVVLNLLSGNPPLQIASSTSKIVRLTQPEEIEIIGDPLLSTYVNFTWTPENPNSNMILSAYVYVEYRCDNPQDLDFRLQLRDPSWQINRFVSPSYRLSALAAEWNQFSFRVDDNYEPDYWIKQNQNSYTINLVIISREFPYRSTYLRNITLILEVVDG